MRLLTCVLNAVQNYNYRSQCSSHWTSCGKIWFVVTVRNLNFTKSGIYKASAFLCTDRWLLMYWCKTLTLNNQNVTHDKSLPMHHSAPERSHFQIFLSFWPSLATIKISRWYLKWFKSSPIDKQTDAKHNIRHMGVANVGFGGSHGRFPQRGEDTPGTHISTIMQNFTPITATVAKLSVTKKMDKKQT